MKLVLNVRDALPCGGLSPATAKRAFEPFFTTGHIEVESRPPEGTTITMHLPTADAGGPSPDPSAAELDAPNDVMVQPLRLQVLDAQSPAHGIELFVDAARRPDLLLTDQRPPA
jgi:hypothetical protein